MANVRKSVENFYWVDRPVNGDVLGRRPSLDTLGRSSFADIMEDVGDIAPNGQPSAQQDSSQKVTVPPGTIDL